MAIEVHNWQRRNKNTLLGFATFRLTTIGLEIRDCPVHEKNGEKWLQMPSRPYQDQDGNTKYAYIIKFYEKERWHQFQASALKALDKYLDQKKLEQAWEGDEQGQEAETPF
jgi:hypothetical protein